MLFKLQASAGRFPWRTFIALIVLFATVPFASAATRVWSGSGGSFTWSDPANWSNGVPVDGDSVLLLRHPLGFPQTAVNDLTNLSLVSLRCEALGYNLSGGTLRLAGEVLMGGPVAGANMNISAPVEIPGPTLNITSTNSSELALTGPASAPSTAVVSVDGGVRFRVIPGSTYQAETRFRSGFVGLLSTRLNGPVVIGGTVSNVSSVALQSGNLFGNFPPLAILTNGSVFNISTFQAVGPLTVNGGTLRLGNRSPQGDITVNGPALLTGGASVFVSAINNFGPGELSVTGTVTLAGCSLAFQPGSATVTQPSVIVRNDGSDPIVGTFNGLPEGSVLTNGPVRYVLSYVGGDGNDITLSPVIEPARLGAPRLVDGLIQFTVQGQPGFLYVTEATTNLLSPPALTTWVPIRTNGTLGDGTFPFTDFDTTNHPRRFYRVVKP